MWVASPCGLLVRNGGGGAGFGAGDGRGLFGLRRVGRWVALIRVSEESFFWFGFGFVVLIVCGCFVVGSLVGRRGERKKE